MRKLLIIQFVFSIFLTQCYIQHEFLTKDHNLLLEIADVEKIKLLDSAEQSINKRNLHKIEADSLIIISYLKPTSKSSKYSSYVNAYDTINISEVHSYFKSEIDVDLTFLAVILGSASLFFLAMIWSVNTSGLF